jgi:hypothetical protein
MKMKVRVTPQKVVTAESSRDAAESRHSWKFAWRRRKSSQLRVQKEWIEGDKIRKISAVRSIVCTLIT